MIVPVPPENVDYVWASAVPFIEKALERGNGEMLPEDVYRFLKTAQLQMALIFLKDELVAAVVTEIIEYPRKRAVRLLLGAGSNLYEWAKELDEVMDKRAKEVQADIIEVHGRPGWARYLNRLWGDSRTKTRNVLMTRHVT